MIEQRLTRRNLLQGAALLTVGTVIAACAPKVQETAVQPKEAEKVAEQPVAAPKETVVLRLGKFAGDAWAADQIWGEKFDDENPNITVEIEDVIYGEMNTKCLTLGATGLLWDVFTGHNRWAAFLAYKGLKLPLDDWVEANNDLVDFEDFFPSVIADARTHGTEGNLYWFPTCVHPSGNAIVAFNMDLLDDAGVSLPAGAPEGDWTMDDWREIILAASKPHEIFGIHLGALGAPHYCVAYTRTWGTDPEVGSDDAWILSRDGRKNQYSDDFPIVREAMEWYTSLARQGYAPDAAELGAVAGVGYFRAEQQVCDVNVVSLPRSQMITIGDAFPITYCPWPKGPNGHRGSCLSYNTTSAYSRTKNPDAALRLAAYLTSPEPSLYAGVDAPLHAYARRSAWFSPELWAMPGGGGEMMRFAAHWFEAGIDPFPMPWNLRFLEYQDALTQNTDLYRQGKESWDEMIGNASRAMQRILDLDRP